MVERNMLRIVMVVFVVGVAVSASMVHAAPIPVGLWEFETAADLDAATIGTDLTPTGTATAVAGSGGADTGAARVDNNIHYTVTNPIGGNGGGSNSNEYTIVMDINVTENGYNSLLQLDGSGDGDFFMDAAGKLGINRKYYGSDIRNAWHRVALVFNLGATNRLTSYVDGSLVHAYTAADLGGGSGAGIDGRWSLRSTFDAFQDDGSEERRTDVSNLALFGTALSGAEVAGLGDVGAPIPEPATMALLGLGGVVLAARRRRQRG